MPALDLAAYAGYTFVHVSLECAVGLFSRRGYYALLVWGVLCTAVFLVKSMKRILYSETRHYGQQSMESNYMLLGLGTLTAGSLRLSEGSANSSSSQLVRSCRSCFGWASCRLPLSLKRGDGGLQPKQTAPCPHRQRGRTRKSTRRKHIQ